MIALRDQLTVASCEAITAEWVKHVVPDIDDRIRRCRLSQAETWAETFPDPISWSELTRRMEANVYVFEILEHDEVEDDDHVEDDFVSGDEVEDDEVEEDEPMSGRRALQARRRDS